MNLPIPYFLNMLLLLGVGTIYSMDLGSAASKNKIIATTHQQLDNAMPYIRGILEKIRCQGEAPIELARENSQFENARILICFLYPDGPIDAPGVMSALPQAARTIPYKILISMGTRYANAEMENSDSGQFDRIIRCPVTYLIQSDAFLPHSNDGVNKHAIDEVLDKLKGDISNYLQGIQTKAPSPGLSNLPSLMMQPKSAVILNTATPRVKMMTTGKSKIMAITHKQFDKILPCVREFLKKVGEEMGAPIEIGSQDVQFENAQILICFSYVEGRINAPGVLSELQCQAACKVPYKILVSLGTRYTKAEEKTHDIEPFDKIIQCPIVYSLNTDNFLSFASAAYRDFAIDSIIRKLAQDIKV